MVRLSYFLRHQPLPLEAHPQPREQPRWPPFATLKTQNLLTVYAGTVWGKPARKPIFRAALSPCEPSGIAQPIATSSILSGATPARATASRTTKAPKSGRSVCRRLPVRSPKGRPNTFYNRYITHGLVPEWLIVHEHILNTLHGFWFTAEERNSSCSSSKNLASVTSVPAATSPPLKTLAKALPTRRSWALICPVSSMPQREEVAYPSRPATLRRRGLNGTVITARHPECTRFGSVKQLVAVHGDAVRRHQKA